jgi:hypothetical protein
MGFSKLKVGHTGRMVDDHGQSPEEQSHPVDTTLDIPHSVSHPLIKSSIAVHDRTQLEAVFDYPLLPLKQFARENLRYQVEAYIFFPRQMGVTPASYPKERFYSDLRPLIRLREPRLTYKQLVGDPAIAGRSPISVIRQYFAGKQDRTGATKPLVTEQEAIDEARIFACALAGYFLRRVERRSKRLRKVVKQMAADYSQESNDAVDRACKDTGEFLDRIHNVMRTWRSLIGEISEIDPNQKDKVHREMRLVDEYCTYRIRDGITRLIKALALLQKKGQIARLGNLEKKLSAHARFDHWYSVKMGYGWITRASDDLTVERYVFRRVLLKRRVWQVLYLDVRTRPLFAFQQQLGAMVAAGVAAFWAVGTEILIRMKAANQPNSPFSSLGTGTLVIVTAFIMAYVLKDRIKELGRSYFSSRLMRSVPDNSERILYRNSGRKLWSIGSLAEYTRFVSLDRLPDQVKKLHRRFDPEGLDSEDDSSKAIHYRKVIDLNVNIARSHVYPLRAVHDILRLNIEAFLSKLDDPLHGTEMLDTEGRLIEMKMPKVYHLGLVLKYSQSRGAENTETVTYESIRLIINKRGLFRIERIES